MVVWLTGICVASQTQPEPELPVSLKTSCRTTVDSRGVPTGCIVLPFIAELTPVPEPIKRWCRLSSSPRSAIDGSPSSPLSTANSSPYPYG